MLRSALTASIFLLAIAGSPFAQTATPTPTPEPTPVPNTVDLSKFKGRYHGSSRVSLDSGALHLGTSKTRVSQTAPNALTIKIEARIRPAGQSISIGNRIDFSADGVVRGLNLAPGILRNAKFSGLYTATSTRVIQFSGNYKKGKLEGHFTGIARAGLHGHFALQCSIFPGESLVAAFVYRYTGQVSATHSSK
jgi:hypothetical protein